MQSCSCWQTRSCRGWQKPRHPPLLRPPQVVALFVNEGVPPLWVGVLREVRLLRVLHVLRDFFEC